MGVKLKVAGWLALGAVAGALATMQLEATARNTVARLPIEELQQLAAVFGMVKTDYVEAVDEKKLISDAIGGMVAGLDPPLAVPRRCACALRTSCLAATTGWLLSGRAAWKRCMARSTSTEARNIGGTLNAGRSLQVSHSRLACASMSRSAIAASRRPGCASARVWSA